MTLDRNRLSGAVHAALAVGVVSALGVAGTAFAQDNAAQQDANKQEPKTLQTVVVTGSHVRRVDLVTSNPVTVMSSQEIQASGKVTLGDLIQDLPANAGSPTNPQIDNGGGTGRSSVSLRGLGSARTLVLINGHRYVNTDLNIIPTEIIERVEVLKDGASAVYGSDAIGGVVNIILKDKFNGAQFTADYGISDADDGERTAGTFIFGKTGDGGSVYGGASYNKQDGIPAANRIYSRDARYLSSGMIQLTGSSRNPNGRVYLPPNLVSQFGCKSVTLSETGSGTGTSLGDYRCYNGHTDAYNYQKVTWDLTPQERTNAFLVGNYQLTDSVQAFGELFYNSTHSQAAIASQPFDANSDGVVISKDNMYNPFGVDFGGTSGYELLSRLTSMGLRKHEYTTTTTQGTLGLKGNIGDWQWSAYYNYGRVDQQRHDVGYPVFPATFRAAMGPSMMVNGTPTCVGTPGDASTAIANCIPINPFHRQDESVAYQWAPYNATLYGSDLTIRRGYYADINGPVFSLPGGDAQLAFGFDYQKLYTSDMVDNQRLVTDPLTGNCAAAQSVCGTNLRGGFDVKEAYAELFLPLLKDLPFIRSLNVTLGDRFTRQAYAGSSNNFKIGIEWRPIDDLLIRGTETSVFRGPTIGDLFAGQGNGIGSLNDPCTHLSAAELAAHSRACAGVPVNWGGTGLSQTSGVTEGAVLAGVDLKPEFGKSFDFGVVYDPHFIPGLSINADYWRVFMNDTLTSPGPQTIMNVCFQDNSNAFCDLISRPSETTHGTLIVQPTVNLGRVDFSGVDFGFQYRLPELAWLPGTWGVNFDSSYLIRADNARVPGVIPPTHMAGKEVSGWGNLTRYRAIGGIHWNMGAWNASWATRYVHGASIGSEDPSQNMTADLVFPRFVVKYSSVLYNDISVGYRVEPIKTKFSVGVNNVFDRTPPIYAQVNTTSDRYTYDFIGRFYWARASVKF